MLFGRCLVKNRESGVWEGRTNRGGEEEPKRDIPLRENGSGDGDYLVNICNLLHRFVK
jgi:hypothetical protein